MGESAIPRWFDRTFDFGFPVSHHRTLAARLRGAPALLEVLTEGLDAARLIARPDGTWSIQENAGHLPDLETLWSVRLDQFIAGADRLAAADLSNRRTHEANHNARPLAAILEEFRRARTAFVDRLDGLAEEVFGRSALHPRLDQSMRLVDHLFFVAEHDDHHLARIRELRTSGRRAGRG